MIIVNKPAVGDNTFFGGIGRASAWSYLYLE